MGEMSDVVETTLLLARVYGW